MVIIVAVSAFIGERFPSGTPQIRVDGEVYTITGGAFSTIPTGSEEIGPLEGVSHHTVERPVEDMWGTNLEPRHAGCPLYRSAGCGGVIYLYDYAGYYQRFVRDGV